MSASSDSYGSATAGHADPTLPQVQVNTALGSKQQGVPTGVLEDGVVNKTYPAVRAWFGTIQAGCNAWGVAKPDDKSGKKQTNL
ncbi:hypothetical protein OH76DRAFT_1484379 [Lentinus brumalis]|uniref:Uncharacterized protein n=1 Tax=Lentinus brumalis TaxID=2498619 RepID=A0A371D5X8_9APHY|nr:hypothetical protein OH76DRAFT_1484379 [Polyporus brumalis]